MIEFVFLGGLIGYAVCWVFEVWSKRHLVPEVKWDQTFAITHKGARLFLGRFIRVERSLEGTTVGAVDLQTLKGRYRL